LVCPPNQVSQSFFKPTVPCHHTYLTPIVEFAVQILQLDQCRIASMTKGSRLLW
jgi:hypothetical protein